jgi:hypothetical protein
MNYTWEISNISVLSNETQSNIVESFDWTLSCNHEGQSVDVTKNTYMASGNDVIEGFTDFNNFTKEDFVTFIENSLGVELTTLKEQLATDVKAKVRNNAKIIVDAPW